MILIRLAFLPLRIVLGVTGLGLRTSYRAGRLVGYGRLATFGLGVAVGVVVASPAAREWLRAAAEEALARVQGTDDAPEPDRH